MFDNSFNTLPTVAIEHPLRLRCTTSGGVTQSV